MNRNLIAAAVVAAGFASSASAAVSDNHPYVKRALAQLREHAAEARLSADDRFAVRDLIVDANGASHVRLDRSYQGLRVIGGDVVVHSDAKGAWKGLSQTLTRRAEVGTNAAVPANEAIALAESRFAGTRNGDSSAEKVVYARGEYPALAWDVLVRGYAADGTESLRHFIVDATSRQLIDQWDEVMTASANGTGKSLYAGTVTLSTDQQSSTSYVLRDLTRGSHYVCNMKNTQISLVCSTYTDSDNVWGNFATSDSATVAVDAAYGQNLTFDYYKVKFGRNGIANNGAGAYSRVHYGRSYVNAYWSDSCFCMTYGDGNGSTYLPLVSIDIAGHEMTHGVTSRSANLTYSGESGGLNEAMSDIFGTLVEYYGNNANEVPNYLVGERIYTSNSGVPYPTKALRYMFKPSLDNASPDCYVSNIGNLDVHYSSGVANHFFYLLTQGAVSPTGFSLSPSSLVCNGNTSLVAISQDDAAAIMYRALTVYMTSSTNYAGARAATLSAASDLFGGTGSTQYASVAAAWSAVSVN